MIVKESWREKLTRLMPQLLRFGCVTSLVLGCKLGIVWLLERVVNPYVSYLITHVVIFLVSYFLHSKLTFKAELSWRRMGEYLKAVIGIKVLDYLIFTVALATLEIDSLVAVFTATVLITMMRFAFARKALLS